MVNADGHRLTRGTASSERKSFRAAECRSHELFFVQKRRLAAFACRASTGGCARSIGGGNRTRVVRSRDGSTCRCTTPTEKNQRSSVEAGDVFETPPVEERRSMRVGLLRVSAWRSRSRWNRTIRSADMSRDHAPASTANCASSVDEGNRTLVARVKNGSTCRCTTSTEMTGELTEVGDDLGARALWSVALTLAGSGHAMSCSRSLSLARQPAASLSGSPQRRYLRTVIVTDNRQTYRPSRGIGWSRTNTSPVNSRTALPVSYDPKYRRFPVGSGRGAAPSHQRRIATRERSRR